MSFGGKHSLYDVDYDVGHVRRADFAAVDALARAQLNARRLGVRLHVVNASRELQQLIRFAGLEEVLDARGRRETEQREEPLGVEERSEARDPSV